MRVWVERMGVVVVEGGEMCVVVGKKWSGW